MDRFGPRNAILFAWQNVPGAALLGHLGSTTVKCMLWTLEPARLKTRMLGLVEGYRDCALIDRRPVRWPTYRLARRLRRSGSLKIENATRMMERAGVR